MPEGVSTAFGARSEPPRASPARERRLDLDRAKGLAILLVVAGHLVANTVPPGGEWYEPARYFLYRFHMPFFLYLSGTVAVLSGALATTAATWPRQLGRRAARLLPPFFAIGLVILVAKLLAMQVVVVDNQPQGLLAGLWTLLWDTQHSPATSVWYLLVLFLCTVVGMLLLPSVGSTGLIVLGLLLQLPDVPAIAYLDRFAHYFLFFAAGVWTAERQDRLLPLMERLQPIWWLLFGLSLAAAMLVWLDIVILDDWWSLVVCGLLCIPALHGLIRLPPIARLEWPIRLGRYAMVIYLFNTLAIGATKATLILLGVTYTAANFPLHLAAAMAAGTFVPILLKELLFRRVRTLDRMTS